VLWSKNDELIAFATFATVTAVAATGETIVAGRAFFTRTRDIDRDLAALKILVMELGNGFLGVFRGGVFHEGETARTAGHLVHHQVDSGHCSRLGEIVLQVIFPRLEGQVADE